jgi:hypothetical protein
MDLTEGSETSAKLNLTPGKYPKENIKDSEHGENLKSRIQDEIVGVFIRENGWLEKSLSQSKGGETGSGRVRME